MSKAKDNIRIGGFVGVNSGVIEDCYSLVKVKAGGKTAGGFAGENTDLVKTSCSYTNIKGLKGGFVGVSTGEKAKEVDCYFFHREKKGSKRLGKLADQEKAQRVSEIEEAKDLISLGFELGSTWQYTAEENHKAKHRKCPILFNSEQWMFDIRDTAKIWEYVPALNPAVPRDEPPQVKKSKITQEEIKQYGREIGSAQELRQWAKEVNEGNVSSAMAYIRLTADIDLGGHEWTPVGEERPKAFWGIFDGEGHRIYNFVLKGRKVEHKGFFGFLKGEVYNLSVDCKIKTSQTAGGLCGVNEGGVIGCCGAVVRIKGWSGQMGGLCGRNTGRIFQSYSAGHILLAIILIWGCGVPFLLGLLLLGVIGLSGDIWEVIHPAIDQVLNPDVPTVYPPPTYDEDQVPNNDGLTPNTEGNFVSFQFEEAVDVNLTSGDCVFHFKNPGNSNHDIVVELQFTDAQATRLLGGTGRDAEEQAALEAGSAYDPETQRTVIGSSQAIRPGYGLESLQLTEYAREHMPTGEFNAMIYLVFYELDTHDRAMLETQLPVVINVHE